MTKCVSCQYEIQYFLYQGAGIYFGIAKKSLIFAHLSKESGSVVQLVIVPKHRPEASSRSIVPKHRPEASGAAVTTIPKVDWGRVRVKCDLPG
ncbi:MAG: hypothetical protein IPI18_17275 [Saprospiraceae bacterium]|nr:hypothetical protein [Saprospiraceae bacterium]